MANEALLLFKYKKYEEAAEIYQLLIENQAEDKGIFVGLGGIE
jgi:hypothetical protein